MTVTLVVPDQQARTLTLTAEYPAPVGHVWQLWADPRQLERWWGPPTYPATVHSHDLRVGGVVTYAMTGPEGDAHAGWWRITHLTAPTGLAFDDGFGDPETPTDLPVSRIQVSIHDIGGGTTRMVITTSFPSTEAMDQMLEMGMADGMAAALGQTDDLLAALAAASAH